ncbi:hypothetical protein ACWD3J_08905 [Streptomyces sp. NPDC002755]|uniref:hypothetical protein n=1 Tax=Streptomyces sp. NPDC002884 TaxID=3154544 RepID=UPI00331AF10E
MKEIDGLRGLARELLPSLPRLVGEDAPRIDHEIRQALDAPGDETLRRVLASDARLVAWIRERPGGEGEHLSPPLRYQMLPGRVRATAATVFTCRTSGCAAPETFLRRNLGQQVPYCASCNRLLSRAPS